MNQNRNWETSWKGYWGGDRETPRTFRTSWPVNLEKKQQSKAVSPPLIKRNKELKYPLEMMENQVRNRNIRAFALLEGKEFPNPISFVETWLPKALNEMQRMSHCMWCAGSGSLPGQSLPITSKAKPSCQVSNVHGRGRLMTVEKAMGKHEYIYFQISLSALTCAVASGNMGSRPASRSYTDNRAQGKYS